MLGAWIYSTGEGNCSVRLPSSGQIEHHRYFSTSRTFYAIVEVQKEIQHACRIFPSID